MIIGIGSDLIDIRRIEKTRKRHAERFERRCFTEHERAEGQRLDAAVSNAFYAKRFAAKEACVKALGTGVSGDIFLKDIGVEKDRGGKPFLVLTNGALRRLEQMMPVGHKPSIHLSLTDEMPYAQAFVVVEAIST